MEERFKVRDMRSKEKFVVDDKFLDEYAKFLGIYAVGVYLSLCRHADYSKQKSWPSIAKIAEELRISTPMVYGAIWTLEFFNIIKKQRIGKTASNRYWLLDKKEWAPLCGKGVDKLLSDINSINITDINSINITTKRRLHHLLTTLTSNSKVTQVRKHIVRSKPNYPPKADASFEEPINNVDNSPYPKPTQEKLKELAKIIARVDKTGFSIPILIQRFKKKVGYFPPPEVMIKACRRYLKDEREIRNAWAWFEKVIKDESGSYFADLNVQRSEEHKKEPVSIGKILSRIATDKSCLPAGAMAAVAGG